MAIKGINIMKVLKAMSKTSSLSITCFFTVSCGRDQSWLGYVILTSLQVNKIFF